MRLIPMIGLTVAMTACDGAGRNDVAPVADAAASDLVYGTDNRLDYYQVSDPALLALADATAVVVSSSQVTNLSGSTSRINTSGTYGGHNSLCSSEPFYSQPDPGYCTAFMVGPDTVATAGHCVSSSDCSSTKFVFGFRMNSASSARTTVDDNDVYSCSSIVARAQSGTQDYAVVRVDRTIVGHTAMAVRSSGSVTNGTPLVLLGHPSGLPIKIAGGATVRDASPTNYFEANVDSYGGNSGSPVVNANTLQVEGILVRGNTDFVRSGSCYVSNVCPDSGCPGWEGITKASLWQSQIPGGSTGGTCTEDAYEENDTENTGAPLGNGTFPNLQVCASDDDWYALDVTSGVPVSITATFTHSAGDIDISLWNSGTRVAISQGTSNSEAITYTPTATGTLDLRVYGYNGAENSYALAISGTGATSGCADDGFEDNDAIGSAAPVTAGAYANLAICTTDDDWYAIPLNAGDVLTADIFFSDAAGDLDMKLYNPGGTQVGISQGTDDAESITYEAGATGTFYVQVYGYQGAAGSYSMELAVDAPLTLAMRSPTIAGQRIYGDVTGATGGASVTLVAGRSGGTTNVPGCAGVTVPIVAPVVVGSATANVGGAATISRVSPTSAAGRTYDFVAVELSTCTVSNVVTASF